MEVIVKKLSKAKRLGKKNTLAPSKMLSFTKRRARGCAFQIIASQTQSYLKQTHRDKREPAPDIHIYLTPVPFPQSS